MILRIWFVFEAIFEEAFLFLYACIFPQYWCYISGTYLRIFYYLVCTKLNWENLRRKYKLIQTMNKQMLWM